jgi:hypothetical protein
MNPRHKKSFLDFIERNFEQEAQKRTSGSTGEEIRIFCPFCHGGASREFSFDINITKGVTRCWRATCGYNGSIGWFIKDFLGVPYSKAMEILEGEAGLSLPDLQASISFASTKIEERYNNIDPLVLGETIDVWPDHVNALDWKNGFDDVCEWLDERGYDPFTFLDQHDLYWPQQLGKFEDRVLFKVSTFLHRAYLAYAIDRNILPKTVNPPGSVLSKMLYNYNRAYYGETIFVCEGIFDSARLMSWGLSAVSVFGVNMSLEQIYLLSKTKAKEICVLFDNGAEDKSVKAVKAIGEYVKHKKISFVPIEREGADPDDLEEDEFLEYFNKRKSLANTEQDQLRKKMRQVEKLFKK